jgi:glycosyltransferase involved in cell wall biosynthesis
MADLRLSLCMIVKNESYFLPKCLEQSAEYVDEIIIVDTGSNDDTKSIAALYTDKIYDFEWQDDFSAARNLSIDKATGDWIIVLDADEVIEPRHWAEIRTLIQSTDQEAFFLTERNYSFESFGSGWQPIQGKSAYTRNFSGYKVHNIARLFCNVPGIRYEGHVHEIVDRSLTAGRSQVVDILIHHHGDESPNNPKKKRQLNYLRLMELDLDSDSSGRLYGTAASIRMHYLKDFDRAIAYYDRAIELGWEVEESQEAQALARYLAGDFDGAYSGFEQLYRAGYRRANLCINFANLAVKRGNTGFAADLLEEAIQLGIPDPKVRISLEHNIRYLREQT